MSNDVQALTLPLAAPAGLPALALPCAKKDLALLLRRLWNEVPLNQIRTTINSTIEALGGLQPGQLIEPQTEERKDEAAVDSLIQRAVLDCCDELREGAGLPQEQPERPSHLRVSDAAVAASYELAIARCRGYASAALNEFLAKQ